MFNLFKIFREFVFHKEHVWCTFFTKGWFGYSLRYCKSHVEGVANILPRNDRNFEKIFLHVCSMKCFVMKVRKKSWGFGTQNNLVIPSSTGVFDSLHDVIGGVFYNPDGILYVFIRNNPYFNVWQNAKILSVL